LGDLHVIMMMYVHAQLLLLSTDCVLTRKRLALRAQVASSKEQLRFLGYAINMVGKVPLSKV
jgi:hypothetical protein